MSRHADATHPVDTIRRPVLYSMAPRHRATTAGAWDDSAPALVFSALLVLASILALLTAPAPLQAPTPAHILQALGTSVADGLRAIAWALSALAGLLA